MPGREGIVFDLDDLPTRCDCESMSQALLYKFHIVVCIALHVLFVLLHVVLLILAFLLQKHYPIFNVAPSVLGTVVAVTSQGSTIVSEIL